MINTERVWSILAAQRGNSAITTLALTNQVVEAVDEELRNELLQAVDEALDDVPSRGADYMRGWADAQAKLQRELKR